MTTKDLRRLCEAAEKQARAQRSAERPAFIVRVMRPAGRGLALAPELDHRAVTRLPIVRAEIEAAGDGDQFETLARFSCGDVRLFLKKLAEFVHGDVELRVA